MRTADLVGEIGHDLRKPVVRAIETLQEGDSLDKVLDAATLRELLGTIDFALEFIEVVTQEPAFKTVEISVPVRVALERVKTAHPQITFQDNILPAHGYIDGRMIARLTELLLKQAIEAHSSESCEIFVSVSVDATRNEIVVSIGDQDIGFPPKQSDTFGAQATQVATPRSMLKGKLSAVLLVCDQIVRVHRGQLELTGGLESKSNFRFSLPSQNQC